MCTNMCGGGGGFVDVLTGDLSDTELFPLLSLGFYPCSCTGIQS